MRAGSRRLALASIVVLSLGAGAVPATLGSVSPAVIVKSWAWATVRQPAASYVPAPKDRGNLLGAGAAAVNHLGVGTYRVDFANAVGPAGGIVHVSSFGIPNRVCMLTSYAPVGPDIQVSVSCTGAGAVPADGTFTVTYLAESGGALPLAYLEADHPGANPYPANPVRSYNSTGGINQVRILGAGQYRVTLPGLGASDGNVQVTPELPTGAPRFCEVDPWGANGAGALVANIRCYKPSGVLANTRFTFSWNKNVGLKGDAGAAVAYAYANLPGNPGPYAPPVPKSYNSAAGAIAITRSAAGRYTVQLNGIPLGGSAVVTPGGAAGNRCFIRSIVKVGGPQRVGVACVNGAGAYADTRFLVSFLK